MKESRGRGNSSEAEMGTTGERTPGGKRKQTLMGEITEIEE